METNVVEINAFTGLNVREASGRIKDTELVDVQNFDLGRGGELVKRSGMNKLGVAGGGGNPLTVIAYFHTSTYSQVIVKVGTNLYFTTDGTTFTSIGNYGNVEWGVQNSDILYMVRRDDVMVKWDGATATVLPNTPQGTFNIIYKARMYVVNSTSTTLANRVFYSDIPGATPGNPAAPPYEGLTWGSPALTQYINVNPGDGDIVTCLASLHGNLFIFKQFSTWLLFTSSDVLAFQLENRSPSIGCVSKYTVHEIEGWLFFVGNNAVYRTDGYTFDEISESVKPLFKEQIVSQATVNQTMAAWWEDKYIICLQTFPSPVTWDYWSQFTWSQLANTTWASGNAQYTWLVYHIRVGQWTMWAPQGGLSAFNMLEVRGPTGLKGVYIGSRAADGQLWRYGDNIFTDGGSNYIAVAETKNFDFDHAFAAKRGMWLAIDAMYTGDGQLWNIADGNNQPISTVTLAGVRLTRRIPGPGFMRYWRARFTCTTSSPIILYAFELASTVRSKSMART